MVFASTLGLDLKISVVLVLHVSCKKRKGRKGMFLYWNGHILFVQPASSRLFRRISGVH